MFAVRDREAGNPIAFFDTEDQAKRVLAAYEENDRREDCYEPDFYEIVEVEE